MQIFFFLGCLLLSSVVLSFPRSPVSSAARKIKISHPLQSPPWTMHTIPYITSFISPSCGKVSAEQSESHRHLFTSTRRLVERSWFVMRFYLSTLRRSPPRDNEPIPPPDPPLSPRPTYYCPGFPSQWVGRSAAVERKERKKQSHTLLPASTDGGLR